MTVDYLSSAEMSQVIQFPDQLTGVLVGKAIDMCTLDQHPTLCDQENLNSNVASNQPRLIAKNTISWKKRI